MYDALDVARYIINYENSQSRSVSNLRLQKLLYFIQAQFLVTNHSACFSDTMEAWDLGPVVPSVYHEYKAFGSSSLPRSLSRGAVNISTEDRSLINRILDKCSRYSTTSLVSMTHRQQPWKTAYERRYDNTISLQSMRSFFGG